MGGSIRSKSCCSLLALALLISSTIIHAQAVQPSDDSFKTYTIPEIQGTISLPHDVYVITPATSPEDPVFDAVGIEDAASMFDLYQTEHIVLDAYAPDDTYDIYVCLIEDEESQTTWDYNYFDNSALLNVATVEESGFTANSITIVQTDQAKYTLMDLTFEGDAPIYVKEYYTVYNGQSISITVRDLTGNPFSEELTDLAQRVAESLQFQSSAGEAQETVPNTQDTLLSEPALEPDVVWSVLICLIFGIVVAPVYMINKRKGDEITKCKKLLDRGEITQKEYDAKKAQLLWEANMRK